MRQARNIDEVNQILKQIQDKLDLLTAKDIDLKGRRVVNAADSVNFNDYTTQQEVVKLLKTAVQTSNLPTHVKTLTIDLLEIVNGTFNIKSSPVTITGSKVTTDSELDITNGPFKLTNLTATFTNTDVVTDKSLSITNGPVNITSASITLTSSPITVDGSSTISGTIPLAALTPTGSTGSITFVNGLATGVVFPT